MTRSRGWSRLGVPVALVAAGVLGTLGSVAPATAAETCQTGSAAFKSIGAQQCYEVPAGVTRLSVSAIGGKGSIETTESKAGGAGALASGVLTVTPGQVLYVEVGANGCGECGQAAFGGGGGVDQGGGGASDVREKPAADGTESLESRLLVAGGGGGGGKDGFSPIYYGGAGGSAAENASEEGGAGAPGEGVDSLIRGGGGKGGTSSAGGAAGGGGTGSFSGGEDGEKGSYGAGGRGGGKIGSIFFAEGGGGGGGWYGGGGGGQSGQAGSVSHTSKAGSGGGGAGSSHAAAGVSEASFKVVENGEQPGVTITPRAAPPAPPTAEITFPLTGGTYYEDEVIHTTFSCTEGERGTGIESCLDSNGASSSGMLSTTTLGLHTYTVTAKSKDGLTGTASIEYTVEPDPPTAKIGSPAGNKTYPVGKVVKTKFSCADSSGGTGIESCTDSNGASGASGELYTGVAGIYTYTVTAKSKDGETGTAEIRYAVAPAGSKVYQYCGSNIGCANYALIVDASKKTWEFPAYGESGVIETVKVAKEPTKTEFRVTSETGNGCVYVSVKTKTGYNTQAAPGNWECGGVTEETWYASEL